uniref:Neurotransmitter-gated ion-channel transmembrane domain-containing protein n=2 Tax=Ciona savignyi TaxID=51511 RepID=H2Y810_CIOSA
MDVTLFPFDWQNCSMIFRSADHDQSEMVFGLRYSPDEISIDDKIYVTSGEWHLCQIPAAVVRKSSDKMFQEVWFTVILRRKPQFYVLNMLLPCVMISVLSCFVFHLPVVAGEKIGLSISLLLGDTIFVFLFAQRMPSAALTVPLVASYLLFSMSLLFLSIVCCVFVYNIHFRSESTHKMHGYWRRLFFDILTPILGLRQPCRSSEGQTKYARVNQELIPLTEAEKSFPSCKPPSERMYYQQATLYGFKARGKNLIEVNGGLSSIPTSIKPASQLYKSTLNTTEELTRHFKKLKAQRKARHDWIYLAFILDSILMWIYLLGFLVGSLCYMFLLWTENYPENIKKL